MVNSGILGSGFNLFGPPQTGILGGMAQPQSAVAYGPGTPQPPQPPGGFLQNNPNALTAIALGLIGGRNAGGGYNFSGVPAAQQADQAERQRQQRIAALSQWIEAQQASGKVIPPATAKLLFSGAYPELTEKYALSSLTPPDPKESLMPVGGAIYDAASDKWITPPADITAATAKTSLVPIWGEDAEGNPMLIQPTDTGVAKTMTLPEGFRPSKGIEKIDGGTVWYMQDKQTGQIVGTVPKDVSGEAAAKAEGEARGAATASLNSTLAKAENALATIQSIKRDPAREAGTGFTSLFNAIPGTPQFDFQQKVNQLKGQAFLDAFKDLKGGGQITNIEGEKATQAIARLETAQTEEGFLQALNELEEIVRTGIARAKASAAGQMIEPTGRAVPPKQPSDGWTDLGNGVTIRVKPQ